jgi:hypothetical protein
MSVLLHVYVVKPVRFETLVLKAFTREPGGTTLTEIFMPFSQQTLLRNYCIAIVKPFFPARGDVVPSTKWLF